MRIVIISVIIFIAFGPAVLSQTPCDEISKYSVRFAIIGDRTGDHQEGVYEAIVAEVERLRPDFVMTVGDHIEGYISDTIEMNKQWDEYFGIIKPLTMPVHITPGNHDITSDAMEPTYRGRVGAPYYSFDHRGIHFVVLDNSRWETAVQFPEIQLNWLRDDLAKNRTACYTFVFFHKPFWYNTLGAGKPDPWHEVFKANGVDAVFTGHFHTFFSAEFDGIMYTSFGSSGGETEESPDGLLYQFGWVTVDGSGVYVAPVKKGAVLPWEVQTLAQARAASAVRHGAITFSQPLKLTDVLGLVDTAATVVIRNPIGDMAWSDTLRWNIPEGWTIEPSLLTFSMAAGVSVTARFAVKPGAKLYPLPSVSTRLPYGEGRSTWVSRDLEIARTVLCPKIKEQVVLDGQLTETCWSRPVDVLFNDEGMPSDSDPTTFYFAHDENNLYVGAYCHDSVMTSLHATMTERDAEVYTEDAVGVMFQVESPSGDIPQIYVNPLGTVCDQLITQAGDGYWSGEPAWNGEVEVTAIRGADSWSVEMRIPLAQFAAKADSGDRWRVQFRRKQARMSSTAALQAPWQYDPTGFGELVME